MMFASKASGDDNSEDEEIHTPTSRMRPETSRTRRPTMLGRQQRMHGRNRLPPLGPGGDPSSLSSPLGSTDGRKRHLGGAGCKRGQGAMATMATAAAMAMAGQHADKADGNDVSTTMISLTAIKTTIKMK